MNLPEHARRWQKARRYTPEKLQIARRALEQVRDGIDVLEAIQRNPLPDGGHPAKHMLVAAYRALVEEGVWEEDPVLLARIRMKPTRTLSGVTTVTVLTQPYPCPGKCIFCPTDVRMPKSYLPDEPGAMRGLQHNFDPYAQVASRLQSLAAVGHPTNKIELLILGGTWSAYRRDYREWFVKRCFDALNGQDMPTLAEAQHLNETAEHRNVGLVIETRPDHVTPKELAHLRMLGVTKVQMGAQSLDDEILTRNQRGHSVAETRRAVALLRAAGFKIVLHWMPNLLGATPASDRADFARLWQDGFAPDELKIYPTQLLANADLYAYWQRGEYQPYSTETLIDLLADIKASIPPYCRVNRVIRDIPSTNVVQGNKRTSLRQDIHQEMARRATRCQCIRCREVRRQKVLPETLRLNDFIYQAGAAEEHFLSFDTPEGRLAGFLRLSLPTAGAPDLEFEDLRGAALIREVHVYGQSLEVGRDEPGAAQHAGLGTQLLARAETIAAARGYPRLAVIAAIGTRQYYAGRGFRPGALYMWKPLNE
ncbi:MAG: tRNA uridine(34) 5-carboxymethylaminomethyl modification radical SAM/GNAT enzyme Elp3 [Anaerolineales bacterium]